MSLEDVSELNDTVEHLINLLVILIELLKQRLLILVHLPIGLLVVIHGLVFLCQLHHLLTRLEYHLILNVCIGKHLDTEPALLEGVLVIKQVSQHLKVVLDTIQPVHLATQLLLRVLLLLLFLPQLRLHGL
jgi:hypothetical protein